MVQPSYSVYNAVLIQRIATLRRASTSCMLSTVYSAQYSTVYSVPCDQVQQNEFN